MKQSRTIACIAVISAAMIFAASCAKEDLDMKKAEVQYGPSKHVTAFAQITPNVADKVYMDGDGANCGKVFWESTDVLTVNNGTMSLLEIDSEDPTNAIIDGTVSPNTNLESGKDVYRSVYPASIIESIPASDDDILINLPATQTWDYESATIRLNDNCMAAYTSVNSGATNFTLAYKNICTVLRIRIAAASGATGVDAQVSKIRLASATGLSGRFELSFSGGIPSLTPSSEVDASNIVELDYSASPVALSSTPKEFVVALPPLSNDGFVLQIWNGDGSKRVEKVNSSATLARNTIYTATISDAFEDWVGPISVSNSQKVYFAHGNLKYHFQTDEWRFFDQQYGMCTKTEVENTLSQSASSSNPGFVNVAINSSDLTPVTNRANAIRALNQWTDHFCFGTSGYNAGNTFYQPWHTFYGIVNGAGITADKGYGYGPMSGGVSQSLTGTYSDWGVCHRTELNNSLANVAGDWRTQTGEWRTLTQLEWDYALGGTKRIDLDGEYKYGMARIEVSAGSYVNGMMMIPDKWHWFLMPKGIAFNPGANGYADNTYDLTQWSVLDQYGAVFLPAGGTRIAKLMDYGEAGYYQSSTNPSQVYANGTGWGHVNQRGYSMYFFSATSETAGDNGDHPANVNAVMAPNNQYGAFNKIDGHCVRLVRNVSAK